jgi:hypothetical protein
MVDLDPKGTAFWRNPILDFCVDNGGYGWRTLPIEQSNDGRLPPFIDKKLAVKLFDLSKYRIDRLIAEGQIVTSQPKPGGKRRIWIDAESIQNSQRDPGKIIRLKEASRILAIPERVLRILKQEGDFSIRTPPKGRKGFHSSDIEGFIVKLRMLVPVCGGNQTSSDSISFQAAITKPAYPKDIKVRMIRRILAGVLRVIAWSGNCVKDIQLSNDEFKAFLRQDLGKRANLAPGFSSSEFVTPLSAREAARSIGCLTSSIPILGSKGYIISQRIGGIRGAIWVDPCSLSRFCLEHLPVRSLANELGTSLRVLARVIERVGFSIVVCAKRKVVKREFFINTNDRDTVVDLFSASKESMRVHLVERDRQMLSQILSNGSRSAEVLRHALILLQLGEGESTGQVAANFSADVRTIREIARRYKESGLDAAINRKPQNTSGG